MPSKIREAALRQDLDSALWRIGVTQNNKEFLDLLPEQLRMLIPKYPEDCDQHRALCALLASKEQKPHQKPQP